MLQAMNDDCKLSTEMQNATTSEQDELLNRLCNVVGIARADMLAPYDPSFVLSPAAQEQLKAVEDPDLRQCLARLLYLQERQTGR